MNSTFELILNEASTSSRKISSFLLSRLQGFSPVLCREICVRAGVDEDKPVSGLTRDELNLIIREIQKLLEDLGTKGPRPSVAFDFDGKKAVDFHCTALNQYSTNKHYNRISDAVDAFYTLKSNWLFTNQQTQNLLKFVEKLLDKSTKRLEINLKTYGENKDYDKLRLYGADYSKYLFFEKGMDKANLVNYYSETGI